MKKYAVSLDEAKKVFQITDWPITEDALKKKYRMLSLQHHPDRGGKHETMQSINAAAETLFKNLPNRSDTPFSKLHEAVDKAVKEYKDIGQEHNESTAEIMDMEEQYKKWIEHGHVDRAQLDQSGHAKIQLKLKSGGELIVRVWKDNQSTRKVQYKAVIDSVSNAPESFKFKPGDALSPDEAKSLYYRAEKYRNYHSRIKEKKKSLSRQKTYEKTFEVKEEGVTTSTAYYTTDPSESTAEQMLSHMMSTNVLKVLSKGPNKGKVTVNPSAVQDLAKAKDSNAKFIAGVVMLMRSYVDKRVTSNWVGSMDASSAAQEIASQMITGDHRGLQKYEEEHKIRDIPYRKEDVEKMKGKTADQVAKEAYDKEFAESNDERRAKSEADYARRQFERSKEHVEKDLHQFNDQGNYSDKFKEHHGEHLQKKEDVSKKARELTQKMNQYAKMIAQVMVQKGLMQKASQKLLLLANELDKNRLFAEANVIDGILRSFKIR